MSCPNCDHTMQRTASHVWWCPRCGTMKHDRLGLPLYQMPTLVERCRVLTNLVDEDPGWSPKLRETLHQLGILESIRVPAERRETHDQR